MRITTWYSRENEFLYKVISHYLSNFLILLLLGWYYTIFRDLIIFHVLQPFAVFNIVYMILYLIATGSPIVLYFHGWFKSRYKFFKHSLQRIHSKGRLRNSFIRNGTQIFLSMIISNLSHQNLILIPKRHCFDWGLICYISWYFFIRLCIPFIHEYML